MTNPSRTCAEERKTDAHFATTKLRKTMIKINVNSPNTAVATLTALAKLRSAVEFCTAKLGSIGIKNWDPYRRCKIEVDAPAVFTSRFSLRRRAKPRVDVVQNSESSLFAVFTVFAPFIYRFIAVFYRYLPFFPVDELIFTPRSPRYLLLMKLEFNKHSTRAISPGAPGRLDDSFHIPHSTLN